MQKLLETISIAYLPVDDVRHQLQQRHQELLKTNKQYTLAMDILHDKHFTTDSLFMASEGNGVKRGRSGNAKIEKLLASIPPYFWGKIDGPILESLIYAGQLTPRDLDILQHSDPRVSRMIRVLKNGSATFNIWQALARDCFPLIQELPPDLQEKLDEGYFQYTQSNSTVLVKNPYRAWYLHWARMWYFVYNLNITFSDSESIRSLRGMDLNEDQVPFYDCKSISDIEYLYNISEEYDGDTVKELIGEGREYRDVWKKIVQARWYRGFYPVVQSFKINDILILSIHNYVKNDDTIYTRHINFDTLLFAEHRFFEDFNNSLITARKNAEEMFADDHIEMDFLIPISSEETREAWKQYAQRVRDEVEDEDEPNYIQTPFLNEKHPSVIELRTTLNWSKCDSYIALSMHLLLADNSVDLYTFKDYPIKEE